MFFATQYLLTQAPPKIPGRKTKLHQGGKHKQITVTIMMILIEDDDNAASDGDDGDDGYL